MSERTLDHVSEAVRDRLSRVEDPELPVTIADLGMLKELKVVDDEAGRARVHVSLVPTFLGCPAQFIIEASVREAALTCPGVDDVEVAWLDAAAWSLDDVTPAARRQLADVGIAVPNADGQLSCPNCRVGNVVIDSEFGGTLCRRLGHCDACGDSIEVMKAANPGDWAPGLAGSLPLVLEPNGRSSEEDSSERR